MTTDRASDEERSARIEAARLEAAAYAVNPDEATWWWLSFTDATLPKGSQFLGACLVDAPSDVAALARSHMLKLNPGGAALIAGPIPVDDVPSGYPRRVLMSREEIARFDAEVS